MKNRIKENLANPEKLEALYREHTTQFKQAFLELYPEIQSEIVAQVWHERLGGASESASWGTKRDWVLLAVLAGLAGMFMQLPDWLSISHDFYYPRNLFFFVISSIGIYFASKQAFSWSNFGLPIAALLFSVLYLNFLPEPMSDTLVLTCIHVPILLWILVGSLYPSGSDLSTGRIEFLRFHGDLLVMSAVILLAGGLFSALTVNLFSLIDMPIEKFYTRYVILSALPSVPLLATFLVTENPNLVNKISPVIARIFTPIVALMLLLFLGAIVFTGKDPYNDRDFLLVFNGVLIGVMALLLFSTSETTKFSNRGIQSYFLLALAVLAFIDNAVALSAISFRLVEFGFTPNRLAVLGSNALILVNLFGVCRQLFRWVREQADLQDVEASMTRFLPIYAIWAAVVSFVFPLLFAFK
ncbi:MAG: hypothetical protein RL638_2141 [Bacteroidota bacterium]|jgi:hypothetical protein